MHRFARLHFHLEKRVRGTCYYGAREGEENVTMVRERKRKKKSKKKRRESKRARGREGTCTCAHLALISSFSLAKLHLQRFIRVDFHTAQSMCEFISQGWAREEALYASI